MGSSTKKIQTKIKKIMKELEHDNPATESNITTIFSETMKLRKNKNYFEGTGFGSAVAGGISIVNSLNSGKLPQIEEELEKLDSSENKELAVQEILDKILDNLELEENELILRAFKITMSELLLNKNLSICKFIELFVKKSLHLLLLEDTNEHALEEFGFIETEKIQEKLKDFSDSMVDKHLINSIIDYSNKKIEFSDLVNRIIDLKNNINF